MALAGKVASTDETMETVRLLVPVLGVVPELGVTASQPALLVAVAVKPAEEPPPDTWIVAVGTVLPTGSSD